MDWLGAAHRAPCQGASPPSLGLAHGTALVLPFLLSSSSPSSYPRLPLPFIPVLPFFTLSSPFPLTATPRSPNLISPCQEGLGEQLSLRPGSFTAPQLPGLVFGASPCPPGTGTNPPLWLGGWGERRNPEAQERGFPLSAASLGVPRSPSRITEDVFPSLYPTRSVLVPFGAGFAVPRGEALRQGHPLGTGVPALAGSAAKPQFGGSSGGKLGARRGCVVGFAA